MGVKRVTRGVAGAVAVAAISIVTPTAGWSARAGSAAADAVPTRADAPTYVQRLTVSTALDQSAAEAASSRLQLVQQGIRASRAAADAASVRGRSLAALLASAPAPNVRKLATHGARAAAANQARLQASIASLDAELPRVQRKALVALGRLGKSRALLRAWQSVAAGPQTSILGAPALDASQIAAWFRASGHRANTTVPIDQIAQDFVAEGIADGVRGDIAFAQSMLETGGFSFPAGGQLTGRNNNFAGIGACDSCAHGFGYPDALTGVRAQLQLLRAYADPGFTAASPHEPVVAPGAPRSVAGKVTSWAALSGSWATAHGYGERVLAIYAQMVGWATDHPAA